MTKGLLFSWERSSHCQNIFGNAVPRRSHWKRSLVQFFELETCIARFSQYYCCREEERIDVYGTCSDPHYVMSVTDKFPYIAAKCGNDAPMSSRVERCRL